jgi:hypothetical protein
MAAAEFRALPAEPLSEEAWDTPCPLGPDDLLAGFLDNGMRLAGTYVTCDIHLTPPSAAIYVLASAFCERAHGMCEVAFMKDINSYNSQMTVHAM